MESYDYGANRVRSRGGLLPSSESMTHSAAYDASPLVRCVLHAHSPVLWRRRRDLGLPETDPAVPYGTPGMARRITSYNVCYTKLLRSKTVVRVTVPWVRIPTLSATIR